MTHQIGNVLEGLLGVMLILGVMVTFWVIRTFIAHWFNEIYHEDGGLSPGTTFVEKILGWIRFF